MDEPLDEIGIRYHYRVEEEPNPKYKCTCGNVRLFTGKAVNKEVWLLNNQGDFADVLSATQEQRKRVKCFFCGKIVREVKEVLKGE